MKVLLVDDEAPARDRLRRLLASYTDVEIVGESVNGLQALDDVERWRPDAVFLDIEMPELDGLSVAQILKKSEISIVFVTAYSEHALKAFELAAIDYLVKPIAELRLTEALAKLRARNGPQKLDSFLKSYESTRPFRFAVKCGSKYVVLNPAEISAIVARDHYAALIVGEKEFLADASIEVLMEQLNGQEFMRVHRSAAINLRFLKSLDREGDRKYAAVLEDAQKTRVAVSRERLNDLKRRLGSA